MNKSDFDSLQQAKPFLRTLMAFCLYLRDPVRGTENVYKQADIFIQKLTEDLKGS